MSLRDTATQLLRQPAQREPVGFWLSQMMVGILLTAPASLVLKASGEVTSWTDAVAPPLAKTPPVSERSPSSSRRDPLFSGTVNGSLRL
jgi:hypothetical protein